MTVGFEDLTYSVDENEGVVEVCAIIEQGEIQGTIVVNIQTNDRTAIAGSDYTALQNAQLSFVSPSTRACTNIDITNDQLYENDENFVARLSTLDPSRVRINPARDESNVEILDDDSKSASVAQISQFQ